MRISGETLLIGGESLDLSKYRRVFVVGAGKASAPMARATEEILGDRVTAGHVIVKVGYLDTTTRVTLHEASHPVPDEAGVEGTAQLVRLIERADEHDLVVCLISGGGSALMILPEDGISLADYRALTNALLRCGADITRINTIRKHVERVKGGRLAEVAAPATLVSLVLSDVVGNPLDFIASGPTVPDSTTYADAMQVLVDFDLVGKVPASIESRLRAGVAGKVPETPKPGSPIFDHVRTVVIGSNEIAAAASIHRAQALGFQTLHLTSFLEGEAREAARFIVAIAREVAGRGRPISAPAMVLCGGETTVTVRGEGRGGRNQELALAAALAMGAVPNVLIAALATDGSDGPTDAAGGFADSGTLARMWSAGIDPRAALQTNGSYDALAQAGDLIRTGPTNTNVNDLTFAFIFPSPTATDEAPRA
jgi:hydroxypyruvate reductase